MKKIVITLEKAPDGNYLPGTHTTYHVMANGRKIGELIHRHSKDTYHVNWDLPILDSEHFRTLLNGFSKSLVEQTFTEEFEKLTEALS